MTTKATSKNSTADASFSATTPNPAFGNILGAPAVWRLEARKVQLRLCRELPLRIRTAVGRCVPGHSQHGFTRRYRHGVQRTNIGGVGTALGLADSSVTLPAGSAGVDMPVTTLSLGNPLNPVWPSYDPARFPAGSTLVSIDPSAGRPARQVMWSLGLQRQLTPNLLVEAAYVANRGVWWQANGLNNINGLTNGRLQSFGLDIANADDRNC